jgi:hypothetical protein
MMSIDQAAFEADIVTACTKHEEEHWRDNDYRACVVIEPGYFVKYDDYKILQPEIATQLYISNYAESQADAPHIPKVIHHFEGDQGSGYFAMEYIKLSDPSPSDLPERTAEALKWLSGVPAPSGHVMGPLGPGRIRHSFFKDYKAPMIFSSIKALELYIDKVCLCLYFLEHPPFAEM